jgi:hypothetical protein
MQSSSGAGGPETLAGWAAGVPRDTLAVGRHGVAAADDGVLRVLPADHRGQYRIQRHGLLSVTSPGAPSSSRASMTVSI